MAYEIPGVVEVTKNILIKDNLINSVGKEYQSTHGIQSLYTENMEISHNDISDVPAIGISFGYGWNWTPDSKTSKNNKVLDNRVYNIGRVVRDSAAGIYSLGSQGSDDNHSVISGNYIARMHNDNAGLYLDEGTAHVTAFNNVVDVTNPDAPGYWAFIHGPGDGISDIPGEGETFDINFRDNYTTGKILRNCEMNYTTVENNTVVPNGKWPAKAQDIIYSAGLEAGYRNLLSYKLPERKGAELLANPGFEIQSEWDIFQPNGKPMSWGAVDAKIRAADRSEVNTKITRTGEGAVVLYQRR
jgi:hypothetical protein